MKKEVLNFDRFDRAIDDIRQKIENRKIDLSIKHIVIVPEKYTLLIEKELLSNQEGSFDVQVVSFSRLFNKLSDSFCMPKEGAIIILKHILTQKKLKIFERQKNFSGFCQKLYKQICQFIMCAVAPDDLTCDKSGTDALTSVLGLKMEEIKDIYRQFLIFSDKMIVDRHGKLSVLKNKLASKGQHKDYFLNSHVYVLNFDYVTGLEHDIFDLISRQSLSFFYTQINKKPSIMATEAEIFSAQNRVSQIKAAAKRIKQAQKSGIPLYKMALVCGDDLFSAVTRIFDEYQIPMRAIAKQKLSQTAEAQLLLSLLDLKYASRDGFINLSKNYYFLNQFDCPVSALDLVAVFEGFSNRFLIDYKGFFAPFNQIDTSKDRAGQEQILITAEQVRQKLVKMTDGFFEDLKKVNSATDFKNAINKIVSCFSHSPQKTAIKKILDTIEQVKLPCKKSGNVDFLIECLKENLTDSVLSDIPNRGECVLVSDVTAFRGAKYDYAFVLDFNEGMMPAPLLLDGVLSEAEIAALSSQGIDLTPTFKQKQQAQTKEILCFLAAQKKLFVSFVANSDLRPSPLLQSVLAKKTIKSSCQSELASIEKANDDYLSFLVPTKKAGLEFLLLNKNNKKAKKLNSVLYQLLKTDVDRYFLKHSFDNPFDYCDQTQSCVGGSDQNQQFFDKLFFKNKTTSASQIQTYYACPYQHFVKFGLRAKKQFDGQVNPLDTGNLIHKAAEIFVKSGFCLDALDQFLKTGLSFKFYLPQNSQIKNRLCFLIKKLCLRFKDHVQRGEFLPMGAEISLLEGGKSGLKPLIIDDIKIKGQVDYADFYKTDEEKYVRIIDYKSGKSGFDKTALLYGINLQS
ncbi:MAG: PD-(D/E)XK nuclease family protein, partial [Firmicutes bacterium]|nr:PD-(D/E)XK nuclease family protein [Bacillota bacterium]